jgi:hypothetical protein
MKYLLFIISFNVLAETPTVTTIQPTPQTIIVDKQ